MNRKQRDQNRANARMLASFASTTPRLKCLNCGRPTRNGHFVPPCFGDEGFYVCETIDEQRETRGY